MQILTNHPETASQVMNLKFDQQFYPIRIRLIGSMVAAAILTYS